MKLNCRPGDLAVVVKTLNGEQVGRVVRCVTVVGDVFFTSGLRATAWVTNPPLIGTTGMATVCPDPWLRPIRDQPGEDETLTWAPVPHKEMV